MIRLVMRPTVPREDQALWITLRQAHILRGHACRWRYSD